MRLLPTRLSRTVLMGPGCQAANLGKWSFREVWVLEALGLKGDNLQARV